MLEKPKRKRGRPHKGFAPLGEKVMISFWCSPYLKNQIIAASRDRASSLSQEVILRLERSFDQDAIHLKLDKIIYAMERQGYHI